MPRGFREGHKPWTSDSEGRRFKLSRFRKPVDKELNSESLQNASCLAQNVSVATDGQISYQSKVTANLTNGDNPLVFDSKTSAENNASTSTSDHQSSYKLQNLSDFTAECLTPQGGSLNNSSEATDYGKNKPFLLPAFYGIPSMAGSVTGSVPSVSSLSQWLHLISDQEAGLVHQKKDITTEMHDLRDEVEKLHLHQRNWEKEASDLLHQKQHLEEELKREKNARQRAEQQITNLQRQLRTQEERVQELETTLSAAQQALDQRGLSDELDWIICRDEIHVTENCLGVGGWGTVLQGTFRGCKVAVKQIHELILSPHNRRLFEREMNIASKCRHPCLLQFIGATNDDGNPLFVTELMESSLRALLQERELSQKETSTIAMDVALALNYLHLNKFPIAHRDVSSANVLLWRQGNKWRAKVSDYGTANFMRHTMTVAPGAFIYCAPEALTSDQTIKMDVYSFGVLVCEMCIRELPDPRRREEQVASVTNHVLRGLIRRCIQSEPGTRPTMEKVINHLEELSYN